MDVPYKTCSRCLKKGEIQCSLCNFAFYCSQQCLDKDKIRHSVQCSHAQRVQQCANCKQQKPQLKYCSQCFYVYYCDSQCQKKDWVNHKNLCNKISSQILECTYREAMAPRHIFSLFLGQSLCNDYLNLENNEGLEFQSDLRILMAGVGDIKNVVKTVTSVPKKFDRKLNFVLNDLSTHSMARNILFLYLAIVDPIPEHMVQIWYSIKLSASCFSYLKRNLLKLAKKPLETLLTDMKGLVKLSEEHWNKCLKVWNGWQNILSTDGLLEKMRNDFFMSSNRSTCDEEVATFSLAASDIGQNGLLLPENSDKRSQARHLNISLFCFNPAKSKEFHELQYVKLDFFQLMQCPALGEMIYGAGTSVFRLPCWPWSEVQKEKTKSGGILAAYESFIRKQFSSFSARVKKGLVNFHLIIDSYKHVRYYLEEGESFDRICVGHLGDVYFYPSLLHEFSHLLNKQNPHAVLLSQHRFWNNDVFVNSADCRMTSDTANVFEAADRLALSDNVKLPSSLRANRWTLSRTNYFDFWPCFFRNLQKQAFAYMVHEMYENKIMHPGQIAKKFNLRLRNFHCEQNKVIPCQIPEENRIPGVLSCNITLEWILDPKMKKS